MLKGFAASEEHWHFHLRLTAATMPRLTTGGDPLLPLITHDVDNLHRVDLAMAFPQLSGVDLIEPWFRNFLGRGGRWSCRGLVPLL